MECYNCIKSCPLAADFTKVEKLTESKGNIPVCNINGRALYFSPVGNVLAAPDVIICGQTPDYATMRKFWALIKDGCSIELAGLKSVYSNQTMRKNLFRALTEINFFKLMKTINRNWLSDSEDVIWNEIFENEEKSVNCGIQLTQSCNCAIVNGTSSKQPPKTIFTEIQRQAPRCLFNSFQMTANLKLIVFLDSPSNDARYHQIDFFKKNEKYQWCVDNGVDIISIPHPSGANRIYNHPESLCQNKHIAKASIVIQSLIEKYNESRKCHN